MHSTKFTKNITTMKLAKTNTCKRYFWTSSFNKLTSLRELIALAAARFYRVVFY